MHSRMFSLIVIHCLFSATLFATDLVIENVRSLYREDVGNSPVSVVFDLSWKNSWSNAKNHDAVWIFMKFNGPWDNHVKLVPGGYRLLQNRSNGNFQPQLDFTNDGLGFFIYPGSTYRGDIDLKLEVHLDTTDQEISWNRLRGLSVFGVEMVYIPEGAFTLGSPDTSGTRRASLYRSDDQGKPNGLFTIQSEEAISVAPNADALYYWSEAKGYNGDQLGPVPAAFPKGFAPFYIMKYELTQGQYADFLNNLPDGWTFQRAPIGGKGYFEKRGSIRLEQGKYQTDDPCRPMNFVSFTDGLAFTDWAALRPITELEYEKAARGPSKPIPYEFVWGTNNYDHLARFVDESGQLVWANGVEESKLTDDNRDVFGASYYWVMDLSGSVWEKVITIGDPIGRAFQGSHGDGQLSFASSTNDDWPTSDHEMGGFGYRGGGYYEVGTGYSDFNPHSPIGYRYYGAWSGGPRSIAYGYRAGRSAP